MPTHKFIKEVSRLAQKVDKLFGGIVEVDLANIDEGSFYFWIFPDTGLYAGAEFIFQYEDRGIGVAPYITSVRYVDHPNFFEDDEEICFNMFDEEFDPSYTVEGFLVGMVFLINNPNYEDPANENFDYNNFRQNEKYIGNLIQTQENEIDSEVENYCKSLSTLALENIYANELDDYEVSTEVSESDSVREPIDDEVKDDSEVDFTQVLTPRKIDSDKFPSRKLRLAGELWTDSSKEGFKITSKSIMLNSFSPMYTLVTQFVAPEYAI